MISGPRASGKTTFCTSIAKILMSNGWDVAGLLSLPIIKQSKEIAKDAFDIRSGVRRTLGSVKLHGQATAEVQTGRWTFDTKTIDWCNTIFQSSIPCDFLVIDEIGPLEFDQGQGFLEALLALDSGEFIRGVVVIRPHLLAAALQRWPDSEVIKITDTNHAEKQAAQWAAELTKDIHPPG
ncbi:MAG: nucleoside-triphosphatase [Chloroflexota bacterium]|nr:nucleoside-triphosphatase [Chloroflexota bacterium]